MGFEPLAGRPRVKVSERRTAVDFARLLQATSAEPYPRAETMVRVLDNLHTHQLASLYAAFAPTAARRFMGRFEVPYTPKHGSWLKRAETDLSVLATPCVDRRIHDSTTLIREVAAWARQRNAAQCRVDWRCTTPDARITLKRLSPSIQLG